MARLTVPVLDISLPGSNIYSRLKYPTVSANGWHPADTYRDHIVFKRAFDYGSQPALIEPWKSNARNTGRAGVTAYFDGLSKTH